MTDPKQGEIWCLKTDRENRFEISYLNCCGYVGFSNATKRKRSSGTMKLENLVARYEPTEERKGAQHG